MATATEGKFCLEEIDNLQRAGYVLCRSWEHSTVRRAPARLGPLIKIVSLEGLQQRRLPTSWHQPQSDLQVLPQRIQAQGMPVLIDMPGMPGRTICGPSR